VNRKNWDRVIDAEIQLDNDANDFYFQWVQLLHSDIDIEDLFKEAFGLGYDPMKVRIKIGKGILFFEVIETAKQ